jgi:hypothetical protein
MQSLAKALITGQISVFFHYQAILKIYREIFPSKIPPSTRTIIRELPTLKPFWCRTEHHIFDLLELLAHDRAHSSFLPNNRRNLASILVLQEEIVLQKSTVLHGFVQT